MKTTTTIALIWIGLLTFIAGFLNGGFLLTVGAAVSHHTGTITRLALNFSLHTLHESLPLILSLAGFFVGSLVSGIVFHDKQLRFTHRYGILLMIFAAFFLLLALLRPSVITTLVITCAVMGMQNGMFIFYKNTVVRTTHFSGYLTDAGLALGMVLRGNRKEWKRSACYLYSILCFFTGAAAAAYTASHLFFYLVSWLYFSTGLFHFIFRNAWKQ